MKSRYYANSDDSLMGGSSDNFLSPCRIWGGVGRATMACYWVSGVRQFDNSSPED